MKKINGKNKIFITIFIIIILVIIGILIYAVKLVGNSKKESLAVTSNTVIFSEDTNLIDTSDGGKIEAKWDGEYYYLASNNQSFKLGKNPVVYDKAVDKLLLMGKSYQVLENGSVLNNTDDTEIDNFNSSYFYKLDDRVYVVVSNEIYSSDRSVYTSKYLIVNIDKQGNASLYNDSINVKSINPMILMFDKYTFDIANEKLVYNNSIIDLKTIIGSTNEYVFKEKEEVKPEVDQEELLESYNKLVNDFTQYANNSNLLISANNETVNNGNNIVINGNTSGKEVDNKSNINKKVSLRGSISYASYIDVTYIVTDPEDQYQAVYLLVTGNINGSNTTLKIMLDKYATTTRINNLIPNSEYTISLGYIEVVKNGDKSSLNDNIEDIINVRTTKVNYHLSIEKIANGKVYFNYKMTDDYAFSSGKIAFYVDGIKYDEVDIIYSDMISQNGFSASFNLQSGNVYQLRVEDSIYGDKMVDYNINKKFTVSTSE